MYTFWFVAWEQACPSDCEGARTPPLLWLGGGVCTYLCKHVGEHVDACALSCVNVYSSVGVSMHIHMSSVCVHASIGVCM